MILDGAVYRNGVGQSKESADAEGEGRGIPRVGVEWDDKMGTFFLVALCSTSFGFGEILIH